MSETAVADPIGRSAEEWLALWSDAEAAGVVGRWDWDSAQDIVYPCDRLAGVFPEGSASGGIAFVECLAHIHADDHFQVQAAADRARITGELRAEYRIRDARGCDRWLLARGRRRPCDPARFHGLTVDITGRKSGTCREPDVAPSPLSVIADHCLSAYRLASADNYEAVRASLALALLTIGKHCAAETPRPPDAYPLTDVRRAPRPAGSRPRRHSRRS